MYVSIRDNMLHATGFPNLAEGLRFYGLDAVEIAVRRDYRIPALTPTDDRPHLYLNDDADVERLREQAEQNGIRIPAFLLGNDFNAEDRATELAWMTRVVEAAGRLGIPAVRIDAVMRGERDLPLAERHSLFAEGVRHILDATDGLTVDLGIENHGFQGNDPAFLEGLLNAVGSPRLGLTIDTGNFYWAGHPRETVYGILERLAPHAKHTHVKNIRYPNEIRETQRALGHEYEQYVCPIPDGDIDHARVVALLRAAGYDRDLCIEDESLGKYEEAGRRANLRAAADYLKSLITTTAPT
jgi:sugar phosphate isomerase/epimerase